MLRGSLLLLLTAATTALPARLSPLGSLLSPYRRPRFFPQPRRAAANAFAFTGETALRLQGRSVGVSGVDWAVADAGRRGKGLFALRDYGENEIVGRYTGVVASVAGMLCPSLSRLSALSPFP